MKRVLALAVACLLVAAALAARAALTSDDGDGEPGDDSDEGDLVIACVPELEAACEALDDDVAELRVEDPGATIADTDVDAWITLDPWPAIAAIENGRDAFGTPVAVAQTDLVLLARTQQVPPDCEPITWACLVDDLGDRVAVPNPDTAVGRLVLGHAATDFHGPGLASNDFADPVFGDRLDALDVGGDPLADIRVGLPEPFATGALQVQLVEVGGRLDLFTQSGGATGATVAVVVAGPRADRVAGEPSFTAALDALGWEVRPDAATSGLPTAGVLLALAQEVR